MSGVSVDGGGKGGRRSLDSEINMIPMIDLLMCMISFLLITAVWSTMSRLNVDAQVPSQRNDVEVTPTEPEPMLHVSVQGDEFSLSWRKGTAVTVGPIMVPKKPTLVNAGQPGEQIRYEELADKVKSEWEANGSHRNSSDKKQDQAVLHCDNRTPFKEIVAVIDAVYRPQREFPGGGPGKLYPSLNVTFAMAANLRTTPHDSRARPTVDAQCEVEVCSKENSWWWRAWRKCSAQPDEYD